MKVFYIMLIITFVLALLARVFSNKDGKANLLLTIIIAIIFSLVSGFRGSNIGDTTAYIIVYKYADFNTIFNSGYEPGFLFLFNILKLINSDPQFMLLITALITNIINILSIRQYSTKTFFELSIFLYVTSGYYLVTMNGIRQCLAAALLFAATTFIIKGRFKEYLVVILFTMTIHQSAFIMIPIYFIARSKVWSKTTIILIAITVFGMILYDPFMSIIFGILGDSKYSGYSEVQQGGANIIRVFIAAVPIILAYIKRNVISLKWPEGNIFVNIVLINLIVMIFSTTNAVFARFSLYFNLYEMVLVPFIITRCFEGKERRILYYCFMFFYFLYYYYDHVITMNITYKTTFDVLKFLY